MKLHKLHVTDGGACSIRHSHAVSSCDLRVRGVAVHLAKTTCGEQHRGGVNFPKVPLVVENTHSGHPSVVMHEFSGELELAKHDGFHGLSFQVECTANLAAG